MASAYLNDSGDVLSLAKNSDPTIAEVQNKNPNVTIKIVNAPDELKPRRLFDPRAVATEYHQKVSGDGTDISHYVLVENLDAYKESRYKQIDDKTAKLISNGFSYDDKQFSMSMQAQMNWNRLRVSILTGVLTALDFPQNVATIDDKVYTINTITEASDFFAAYANRLEQRLRSGRMLKTSIRQSTTKAEIDAITDDRQEADAASSTISAKRQEMLTTNYVDWKFEVVEKSGNKISSVKRYTTDNGDGTYSGLVQEELYSYQGNKLLSITTNTYDADNNIELTETETFHADGSTTISKFS